MVAVPSEYDARWLRAEYNQKVVRFGDRESVRLECLDNDRNERADLTLILFKVSDIDSFLSALEKFKNYGETAYLIGDTGQGGERVLTSTEI